MKIVKRDGRIVEYNREKIYMAIKNANRDVKEDERATDKEINKIIKYIEDLNKKRILVEDIQDIIETELMKLKRYNLAKEYIIYRYTRALVRKRNTTDESILSIIKNKKTNSIEKTNKLVSQEHDLIAGEVSKDLSKRILWPVKIRNAYDDGIIYFHDADYFVHPMISDVLINYDDMLENGTIINNIVIDKPKSFNEACNILSQIIIDVQKNIYGTIMLNIKYLSKYLKKSTELKEGIKNLLYNLLCNSKEKELPSIIILLEPCDDIVVSIIEELFKQFDLIKYENKFNNNIELIYLLNNETKKDGKYFHLTKKAIDLTKTINTPSYININNSLITNKFNQGMVTINLAQIILETKNNEELFWKTLDERLDICYDSLLCKYHYLLGTTSNVSPILWQHGGIKRLEKDEKIDKLLYTESTLVLGYLGLNKIKDTFDDDFVIKLLKYLKKKCNNWSKETNLNFILLPTINKSIATYLKRIDQEKYDIKETSYNNLLDEENNHQPIRFVNLNKNTDIELLLDNAYNNEQYIKFIK